jgi:hypothetical protein
MLRLQLNKVLGGNLKQIDLLPSCDHALSFQHDGCRDQMVIRLLSLMSRIYPPMTARFLLMRYLL